MRTYRLHTYQNEHALPEREHAPCTSLSSLRYVEATFFKGVYRKREYKGARALRVLALR